MRRVKILYAVGGQDAIAGLVAAVDDASPAIGSRAVRVPADRRSNVVVTPAASDAARRPLMPFGPLIERAQTTRV